MSSRQLALLLLWVNLASFLWFNILLVMQVAQLEEESRGLFSPIRGSVVEGGGGSSSSYDNDDVGGSDDNGDDDMGRSESHHYETRSYKSKTRNNHHRQSSPWDSLARVRTQRKPQLKAKLGDDFISPVANIATACVVKNIETGKCSMTLCHNDNQNNETLAFAHGPILRDNSIRGTTMMVSGKAHSGSGCALSHKHRFLYIHVLKSGGMTMKAFLKKALCGGSTQMPCVSGTNVLQIVDCGTALSHYPEYFVFSFVRNPYSRLYSGYSMATMYGKEEVGSNDLQRRREEKVVSFRDFALQPRVRQHVSQVSTSHYVPQSAFLYDKNSCPVFDYIGRLEHFQEDLLEILKLIGSRELLDAFHNGTLLQYEQSTAYGSRNLQHGANSLSRVYKDEQVRDAVAHEFASDFELFGYDAQVLP